MAATTIGRLLDQLTQQLAAVSESARLDAEVLLCFVLQQNKTWLYTWPERELTELQNQQLQSLISRRLKSEPIAHLTGQREFWSLVLDVSPDTLIPRPDTELLVETALELLADRRREVLRVVDLGTGSGAIALALASERPRWRVCGVDRIAAAVRLAQRNQSQLHIPNARFLQSDWFAALAGQQFDLIVSNPPYIEKEDPHLLLGDVRFEPRSALISEQNGLQDIDLIVAQAPEYLAPQGWLLLEHGYEQGEAVRSLLTARGFTAVQTRRDLAGHERATLGQRSVESPVPK